MDCMFMGPYARLDYGPRGHRNSLPTQSWSRSDTEADTPTRSFSLPCSMAKAHGDYDSPFTCGSEARRAVIKYFVRDYAAPAGGLPGQCGTDDVNRHVQVFENSHSLA